MTETYIEERYIGNRIFRKLDDGRLVEVLSDGSHRENILIDGELVEEYGTSFEDLQNKIDHTYLYSEEPDTPAENFFNKPETDTPKTDENKPRKKSMEEIVQGAIDKWSSDSGLAKGGSMDSGGNLGGGSGIRSGNEIKPVDDPLKRIVEGRKAESFSDHMAKVTKAFEQSRNSGMGSKRKIGPQMSSMMGNARKKRFMKK